MHTLCRHGVWSSFLLLIYNPSLKSSDSKHHIHCYRHLTMSLRKYFRLFDRLPALSYQPPPSAEIASASTNPITSGDYDQEKASVADNDLIHLSAPQSALERLPIELKLAVLEQCFDISSLLALIGASPSYLEAFLMARQELLTLNTLRGLEKRVKFPESYLPVERNAQDLAHR